MARTNLNNPGAFAILSVVVLALSTAVTAETAKIEGFIVAKSGDEITVKFGSGAELTFLLTDDTQVSQMDSVPKEYRKNMYTTLLIPGLKVQVEGTYGADRQVIATKVKFKNDDLDQARAAQAATQETKQQAQANTENLEQQNAQLKAQNEALQQQQAQLTEQQQRIEANKAAIAANTARFGELDDYYIWDEVTVAFGNGEVQVEPQYETQLLALAEKAKTVDGYVIEVVGYASSPGSVALNQKLSQQRADSVTNILLQKGHVPLTRMLAPGAMGEAHQVGDDKTGEGQAENRRVVVRVLQSKGIAGATQAPAH